MPCHPCWPSALRAVVFAGLAAISPWPAMANSAEEMPRFRDAEFRVNEDAGGAEITVVRDDTSGQSFIRYETADGTATASKDYQPASGTLAFAAGEAAKTFRVPILDDGTAEGDETVQLKLRSAGREDALSGGVPPEGSTATLAITGNDGAGGDGAPDPATGPEAVPPSGAGADPAAEAGEPGAADPNNPEAAPPDGAGDADLAGNSSNPDDSAADDNGDDDDAPAWALPAALVLLLGAAAGATAWKLKSRNGVS